MRFQVIHWAILLVLLLISVSCGDDVPMRSVPKVPYPKPTPKKFFCDKFPCYQ